MLQALQLARALAASPVVRLAGIECYEGGVARCDSEHDVREVTGLVRRVVEAARKKVADALINGKALRLEGGPVIHPPSVVPTQERRGCPGR